jgi:hypothetical protein
MTRRSSPLRKAQRTSYRTSRLLGDLSAASRGTLPKRLVRRSVTRSIFRAFR